MVRDRPAEARRGQPRTRSCCCSEEGSFVRCHRQESKARRRILGPVPRQREIGAWNRRQGSAPADWLERHTQNRWKVQTRKCNGSADLTYCLRHACRQRRESCRSFPRCLRPTPSRLITACEEAALCGLPRWTVRIQAIVANATI